MPMFYIQKAVGWESQICKAPYLFSFYKQDLQVELKLHVPSIAHYLFTQFRFIPDFPDPTCAQGAKKHFCVWRVISKLRVIIYLWTV